MHWIIGKVRITKIVELENGGLDALHPAAGDR